MSFEGSHKKRPANGGLRNMPSGLHTPPVSSATPSVASIFIFAQGCRRATIVLSRSPFTVWRPVPCKSRARDLQGTGLHTVNGDLDKTIVARLQPWAKMKMEATDGVADDTGGVCKPDGIFRNPPFAGRFLWLPSKDMIALSFH